MRRGYTKGLVYTIDLSKIADRENPRTVEAPLSGQNQETCIIDWGDGTVETYATSAANFPAHTYAEGAGDVFTVVIKSATGHIPYIRFNSGQSYNVVPTMNLSHAVISVDHFAGWSGHSNYTTGSSLLRNCPNYTYVDTRLPGLSKWNNFDTAFGKTTGGRSSLSQPIASFCFDFVTQITSYVSAFYMTDVYGDIPAGFFDNCKAVTTFGNTFNGCDKLTSTPYVFWSADGTLDKGKFPNLTSGSNCYANCSEALRAQVPVAYGGTMTVS